MKTYYMHTIDGKRRTTMAVRPCLRSKAAFIAAFKGYAGRSKRSAASSRHRSGGENETVIPAPLATDTSASTPPPPEAPHEQDMEGRGMSRIEELAGEAFGKCTAEPENPCDMESTDGMFDRCEHCSCLYALNKLDREWCLSLISAMRPQGTLAVLTEQEALTPKPQEEKP